MPRLELFVEWRYKDRARVLHSKELLVWGDKNIFSASFLQCSVANGKVNAQVSPGLSRGHTSKTSRYGSHRAHKKVTVISVAHRLGTHQQFSGMNLLKDSSGHRCHIFRY